MEVGQLDLGISKIHQSPFHSLDLRLFLFQTWLASGPLASPFNPAAVDLEDNASPLVVFATKRGRVEGCGETLDEAVDKVAILISIDSRNRQLWKCIPFSPNFGAADDPGALGTENFANDTGLKAVGFFTEPVRACCRPSLRLVSVSDPPSEPPSSPPSERDATPFSSSALVATAADPCLPRSCKI